MTATLLTQSEDSLQIQKNISKMYYTYRGNIPKIENSPTNWYGNNKQQKNGCRNEQLVRGKGNLSGR